MDTKNTSSIPQQIDKDTYAPSTVVAEPTVTTKQQGTTRTALLTVLVGIACGAAYGMDLVVAGAVVAMPSFQKDFFPNLTPVDSTSPWCDYNNQTLQLVTSAAYIAAVVVTFPCIWLSTRMSRSLLVVVGGILYLIGAILEVSAPSGWIAMIYTGRAFVGSGMAICNQIMPMYLSEASPPGSRGFIIVSFPIGTTVAILIGNFVNYGTTFMTSNGWRVSFSILLPVALVIIIGSWFLPDTPLSMVARGCSEDQVKAAFYRLRQDSDFYSPVVQKDLIVEKELREERYNLSPKERMKHFFQKVYMHRAQLVVCLLLGTLRSLTGNPLFLFYAPELYGIIGESPTNSMLYTAISVGVAQVVGTIIALVLVERSGRRYPMIVGSVVMLACNTAAAILLGLTFSTPPVSSGVGGALIAIIAIFEIFVCISILSLSWIISQEICPLRVKAAGSGLHVIGDLGLQIFFAQMLLTLLCYMTFYVFVMSAGFCIIMLLFSLFGFPETQGASLAEVQRRLKHHWFWKKRVQLLDESDDDSVVIVESGQQ